MNKKLNAYINTIFQNIKFGQSIGNISNKYPLYITPSSPTFSIWALIYIGLFFYSFSNTSELETDLFINSMELNSKWLETFSSFDFKKSFTIIENLKDTNIKLTKESTNYISKNILFIYSTWTTIASELNRGVYEKYILNKGDTSLYLLFNLIKDFKSKKNIFLSELFTLYWAIGGINTSLIFKKNGFKNIQKIINALC